MGSFKVKRRGGRARQRSADEHRLEELAGSQSGRLAIAGEGEESFAELLDYEHSANEATARMASRRWLIRVIFAFGRENGQQIKRKQVGVFVFKPHSVPATMTSDILDLSHVQRGEALKEAQAQNAALVARDYFIIEDDGPTGYRHINRQGLVDFVLKTWRSHPIRSVGDIELHFEHVKVRVTRDELLHTASREDILTHLRDIIDLMDRGFLYDPWTESLRPVDDHKPIGPWAAKR